MTRYLARTANSFALRLIIAICGGVGGAAWVSSSVFAALTAVATSPIPTSVSTGTITLTLAPSGVNGLLGGFSTPITNMAPGDRVNRYINLVNGGTIDGASSKLGALNNELATPLLSDTTNGLQVTIFSCPLAWNINGTCPGTPNAVAPITPIYSIIFGGYLSLNLPSTAAGAINRLKFTISLPSNNEVVNDGVLPTGSIQGFMNSFSWVFMENPKNVSTNS